MISFREKFDRGHRHRWIEKLQNNLKEYFVNAGCIEMEQVMNQMARFIQRVMESLSPLTWRSTLQGRVSAP
jgi:hypothetical protein